ncbi:MAG: hypothetical protein MZV64_23555 [Ignavibacteriales bacterium]|nr:hypothetical protein [Ignavibacteriales bacterium]
MPKASETVRWWDWIAIAVLFIMVETSASAPRDHELDQVPVPRADSGVYRVHRWGDTGLREIFDASVTLDLLSLHARLPAPAMDAGHRPDGFTGGAIPERWRAVVLFLFRFLCKPPGGRPALLHHVDHGEILDHRCVGRLPACAPAELSCGCASFRDRSAGHPDLRQSPGWTRLGHCILYIFGVAPAWAFASPGKPGNRGARDAFSFRRITTSTWQAS